MTNPIRESFEKYFGSLTEGEITTIFFERVADWVAQFDGMKLVKDEPEAKPIDWDEIEVQAERHGILWALKIYHDQVMQGRK